MLELVITIIFVYFIYYLWIAFNFDKEGNQIKRGKKKQKENDIEKKMPSEVKFFVDRYNIDLNKVNYRYFLQMIGLVVAIDIAIISNVIVRIKTLWLALLIMFVLVILLIFVSFGILGRYFNKKGLTKDDDNKRNRK